MEGKEIIKEYTNGELTIVWRPAKCIHSTNCWKGKEGLLSVFNPSKRPWVNPEGASTEDIVQQIEKCPSGALQFYYNEKEDQPTEESDPSSAVQVQVTPNGPLLVKGSVTVTLPDGSQQVQDKMCALCRCGHSTNKPYCDGSHKAEGWEG